MARQNHETILNATQHHTTPHNTTIKNENERTRTSVTMTAKEGMRDTTDRGSDKNDEQKTGVSAASPEDDVIDVVIPPSLLGIGAAPDSTLLVQIDPENAQLLELEGSNGAIGRFEADSDKGGCCWDGP